MRTRLIVAAMILVGLALFHRPWLRGIARLLIVDEPLAQVDYLWVPSKGGLPPGNRRYYETLIALLDSAESRRVLLVEPLPHRLVEMGVMPAFVPEMRRRLEARGFPGDAVLVLPRAKDDFRHDADLLQAWLEANPKTRVALLCDPFDGWRMRLKLSHRLNAAEAARVAVVRLSDRDIDENNWWRSRSGMRHFLFSWLRLIHTAIYDEPAPPRPMRLEEYEQLVLATLQEARR